MLIFCASPFVLCKTLCLYVSDCICVVVDFFIHCVLWFLLYICTVQNCFIVVWIRIHEMTWCACVAPTVKNFLQRFYVVAWNLIAVVDNSCTQCCRDIRQHLRCSVGFCRIISSYTCVSITFVIVSAKPYVTFRIASVQSRLLSLPRRLCSCCGLFAGCFVCLSAELLKSYR